MSDFYAKAASNTFHVRDATALRAALEGMAINVHPADRADPDADHIYLVSDDDKGRWPSERFDEATHEAVDVDLLALIAQHLCPGEVAVLKEAGSEKAIYIGGIAHAVNSAGQTVTVDLDEIYQRAAPLGTQIAVDV
jgi:hypothetical protein